MKLLYKYIRNWGITEPHLYTSLFKIAKVPADKGHNGITFILFIIMPRGDKKWTVAFKLTSILFLYKLKTGRRQKVRCKLENKKRALRKCSVFLKVKYAHYLGKSRAASGGPDIWIGYARWRSRLTLDFFIGRILI